MILVCSPDGWVLVADVCVREEHSDEYDRIEKLRDESHVHALTESEFTGMFGLSGLTGIKRSGYGLHTEVESQPNASSHNASDMGKILDMINSDIGVNYLGINARRENDRLIFTFPIALYLCIKSIE